MAISGRASPAFCVYLVAAERQGVDPAVLNGTLQTDIFEECMPQQEYGLRRRSLAAGGGSMEALSPSCVPVQL